MQEDQILRKGMKATGQLLSAEVTQEHASLTDNVIYKATTCILMQTHIVNYWQSMLSHRSQIKP
jgi:hypothetical protein